MTSLNNTAARHRAPLWLIAVTLTVPAVIVAASIIQTAMPIDQLYRDTVRASIDLAQEGYDLKGDRLEPYVGAISNIGALAWCFAAAVCLFAATLVDRKKNGRAFACLLSTGLFSAALMFDDLFLAHEVLYPHLFGLSEKRLFAGYALLMLIYTVVFWRVIQHYAMSIFLLCMITMIVALTFDVFDEQVENAAIQQAQLIQRLGEDGLKLIGVFAWAAFASRLSWLTVRDSKQ